MAINLTGSFHPFDAPRPSTHTRAPSLRRLTNLLLALTLALVSGISQASLTTSIDRRQVSDADLILLKVRLENAGTNQAPDFSLLEQDFEIISIKGPQSTSRTSIINGNTTAEVYVLWELSLRPRRLGQLIVPALVAGNYRSAPIQINVVRQTAEMRRQASEYVFFETSTDTNETYVQAQVLYTVKLFYVDAVSGDFPAPPVVDDAVIEAIEGEQRYDAVMNNRRYYVLEKRYAIYPQKSGELVIPSETFAGSRGSNRFFGSGERVVAVSEAHTIRVNPRPASFPGDNWLPASGLILTEAWSQSPPTFTVGEPINRTLTLTVEGVAGSLLPPMPALKLANAKTYEDPPTVTEHTTVSGIVATQTYTIGIVPTAAGTLQLPAIRIPWWNTRTDSLAYAELPAASFSVQPSASPAIDLSQLTPIVPAVVPDALDSATSVTPAQPVRDATPLNLISSVLAVIFAVLWLITLGLWWLSRRQARRTNPSQPPEKALTTNEATRFAEFTRACRQDEAGAARQALMLWGLECYPSINSLQELGQYLDKHSPFDDAATQMASQKSIQKGIEKGIQKAKPITEQIAELETFLYGSPAQQGWQGAGLLAAVTRATNQLRQPQKDNFSPFSNLKHRDLVPALNPGGR
jgi:hypothetical protein